MKPYGPWMRASSGSLGNSAGEKWLRLALISGKMVLEVILREERMTVAQVTSDMVTEDIMGGNCGDMTMKSSKNIGVICWCSTNNG